MKPYMKVSSVVLAVMMIFATIMITGCTPISLNKEWAYKTDSQTLDIGVYIYSLDVAYQQAQSYAEELDDYDETTSDWLDLEITDDDGNTEVARTWIKNEAKKMCLSYLVLDEQLEKYGATLDEDTLASADEQAETYWNVGQYADYGYIMPMSDDLEPYGISLDSFAYCTTEYSTKYEALFKALYEEGGDKEVTDSELTDYFTENYADYSYFSIDLYESTTDESGDSSTVALSDEEIDALTNELDGYAEELNSGTSYDDMIAEYMEANELESDPSTSNVEVLEDSSIGDELVEALGELGSNEATTVKVGDDDSAVYYLIYKRDINDDIDDYINDETSRENVLASMKSDEFADYIDELVESFECEENTSVIDKYKPEMFFVATETTAADDDDTSSES
ncbi:MAG: hypothetical protein LUF33_08900 [Clostridiales bacterium]|nr:hypothetical protein [Clostridiales bacterium]